MFSIPTYHSSLDTTPLCHPTPYCYDNGCPCQSHLSAMKPGTTWVERGPDGRPYFVRKRTKLSRALHLPFAKAFKKDFHISASSQISQLALAMNPYQQPAPGEPQRYPAPHPNMFPIPPPNPFPTQPFLPPEAYQQAPLPAGARFISPPRFPTADDLKYKCSICGRFRSPNYHYRHPIPAGELPRATVCRRCREEATDSEDSEEYEERVPRARRSRSVGVPPRHRRSSSRGVRIVEQQRPQRGRSPGVEVVRYDEPRPRAVYVDDDRRYRRSGSSYEDDLYIVSDEEYDCPPRTRLISRVQTPMPRIIRRQSSDPDPYLVERHEYYDGQHSVIEERTLEKPSRPVSRVSMRSVRVVREPRRRPYTRREESHSEEEIYARPAPRRPVFEEGDWYAGRNRNRGRSRSRHERSRSRLSTYDDGDDHPVRRPSMLRPPFPGPVAGTSSLGYLESRPYRAEVDGAQIRQREEDDRRSRAAMVTSRRRLRSRSRSIAEPSSTFLRPGDNITVVERHSDNDYDTYDRDGMRVRVREI